MKHDETSASEALLRDCFAEAVLPAVFAEAIANPPNVFGKGGAQTMAMKAMAVAEVAVPTVPAAPDEDSLEMYVATRCYALADAMSTVRRR